MQSMRLDISQKLGMKLKIAPQIIQSIEILQMNTQELSQHVSEEMMKNPTMELEDTDENREEEVVTREDLEPQGQVAELVETGDDSKESLERELDRLESMHESWKEFSDSRRSYGGSGDKDKKMEAMQNAPEREETLQEHVLAQLANQALDDRRLAIGEYLAYSLDERGYLKTETSHESLEEDEAKKSRKKTLDLTQTGEVTEDYVAGIPVDPPAEVEEVEEVLHLLQSFEPPGVGARDLKECLLIQIGMAEEYWLERRIVRDFLDDVVNNRLPKIAKAIGEPVELIDESIKFIGALNPHPGSIFRRTPTQYVVPDILVQEIEGNWEIRLEDTYVPHIRISPRYREILEAKGDDPNVMKYIRKKIERAEWLKNAIEQRQQTLRRIAEELVDYQKEFFEIGVDALKPLKMEDIARRVDVHVSTVSRAISGKYMQTPRGIFSLRYFFKGGAQLDDGSEISIVAIKEKVRRIVDNENKNKPLSDEGIAKALKKQFGLEVARRTITKYRKAMNIPASRQRRSYV